MKKLVFGLVIALVLFAAALPAARAGEEPAEPPAPAMAPPDAISDVPYLSSDDATHQRMLDPDTAARDWENRYETRPDYIRTDEDWDLIREQRDPDRLKALKYRVKRFWHLDLEYEMPRAFRYHDPEEGLKIYWYMIYRVTNNGEQRVTPAIDITMIDDVLTQDIPFVMEPPAFEVAKREISVESAEPVCRFYRLENERRQAFLLYGNVYRDLPHEAVRLAIARQIGRPLCSREDMNRELRIGEEREGVAIFPPVSRRMDRLYVLISGYHNELRTEIINNRTYIFKSILKISYRRPGDEYEVHEDPMFADQRDDDGFWQSAEELVWQDSSYLEPGTDGP